ncbi:MAG: DUF362 domain-containing protein [Polyangiaceae bacterium]
MSKDRPTELSRRRFLETAIGTAAAIGLGAACNGSDSPGETSGLDSPFGLGGAHTGGGADGANASTAFGGKGSVGGTAGVDGTASGGTGGVTGQHTAAETEPAGGRGGATAQSGATSAGGSSSAGSTTAKGGASSIYGNTSTGGVTSGSSTSTGNALVGIVRNGSVVEATKQAIAMIGGFPNVKGKSVLLKPNVNTGDPSPFSTNPEIARAVIELCKVGGASRIVIADRSYTPISTTTALAKSGLTTVAKELGVETIDLDGSAATAVKPSGATSWPSTFRMYNLALTGVDVVINLCCCKNHNSSANFTASLKNWVGLLHTGDRNTAHGNIGNRIPELHLAIRESLIVMDATGVVLTLGPNPASGQATASPGLVVATRDNVACDVTCLAILKHYLAKAGIANTRITGSTCWTQPQIQRAVALGLWITKASQYNYSQSGVTEMTELLRYINA